MSRGEISRRQLSREQRVILPKRDFAFMSVVHSLSSALCAGSFWILLWYLFQALVQEYGVGLVLPQWMPIVVSILAIIAEVAFTLKFYRQRISPALRWRLVLIMILIAYFVASMAQEGGFFTRLLPGLANIGFTILTLLVFTSMGAFHHQLLLREELATLFENLKGEDLLQTLQREQPRILEAFQKIKAHNRSAFFILIGVALLNFFLWISQAMHRVAILFPVLTVICVLGGLLALTLGNSYLDDHRSLQRTKLMSVNQRVGRVFLAIIMVGAALLVGLLISGPKSILPPELLLAIVEWLTQLFAPGQGDSDAFLYVQNLLNPPIQPMEMPITPEDIRQPLISPEIWELILEILRNGLIICGSIAVIAFLFYPMLRKAAWKRWKAALLRVFSGRFWQRIFLGIRRVLRRMRSLLRALFRMREENYRGEGISEREYIEHYLRELKKDEARSKDRKVPARLIQLFERYVSQAVRLGVVLKRNLTLRDLARLAAKAIGDPEALRLGVEASRILERILYDLRREGESMINLMDELERAVVFWESLGPPQESEEAEKS